MTFRESHFWVKRSTSFQKSKRMENKNPWLADAKRVNL